MNGPHGGDAPPRDPRRTLTSLGVVVYDWDLVRDAISWGPTAAEVLGCGAPWPTGTDLGDAVDADDQALRREALAELSGQDTGSGSRYALSYRLNLTGGRIVQVDDSGRWFAGEDGRPARAHGSMRLRAADEGNGEPRLDRAAFLSQVALDIGEAKNARRPLSLFAIAITNLGELNETIGFETADRVIEAVIARLCGTMRRRDRFVRYSGNRFALALRGCGPGETDIAAQRLLRLAGDALVGTRQGAVPVRLAIGAACAPDHALDAGMLLRRAETCLAAAKGRPEAGFVLFDARLARPAQPQPRDLVRDALDAINGRRIAVAYQPVVEAVNRIPVFEEALLRLTGEDGRPRPAGDVVPALEAAGLVHLADLRVLEIVADRLAAEPDARISFNASPKTIEHPDWLVGLAAHLGRRPGIAARLIVELTETAAIRDPDGVKRTLDLTKALGVAVAIDDFGSGHTSFRTLRTLPVDLLKIDGAFIQNLSRSPDDRIFVRTLVDLAHHLGIATVAEWVEDDESARLLASWGVDFLQGDLCGRPRIIAPAPETVPSIVERSLSRVA